MIPAHVQAVAQRDLHPGFERRVLVGLAVLPSIGAEVFPGLHLRAPPAPELIATGNWVRSKPWVSSPIVNANRPDELRESLGALARPLSAGAVARLDGISDFERSRPALEN